MRIPGLDTLRRTDPTAAAALQSLFERLVVTAESSAWALDEVRGFAEAEAGVLEHLTERMRVVTGAEHVAALRWTGALAEGQATVDDVAGDAEMLGEETPSLAGVSSTLLGRMLTGGRPVWRDGADGGATLHGAASLLGVGSAGCVPVGQQGAAYLTSPSTGAFPADRRAKAQVLGQLAAAFLPRGGAGAQGRAARGRAGEGPRAQAIPGLVGDAPGMRSLYAAIRAFAAVPWPALVLGETGTGKEAVARALHLLSPRAPKPFLAFNAGAVTPELAESLLFGHERGAFTGADKRREGLFERVGEGTLFLDEVGELPPRAQASLLRALQERTFERVGGTQALPFRGRVVAATWRPVDDASRRGDFRSDLFHRLGACILRVPPLRDRPGDLPALAAHLLERASGELALGEPIRLSPGALVALQAREWPGNVRELENTLREALARAVASGATQLSAEAVAGRPTSVPPPDAPSPALGIPDGSRPLDLADATDRYQRVLVQRALEACGGNRTEAAAWLGVSRPWLYRLLQRWGDG